MVRKTLFASALASGAVILSLAAPAYSGEKDRAEEAIAAAEAKINTAESIGTGVEVPAATAAARAALAMAKEDMASGHKSASIDDAIHASELADTAIGELQRHKDASVAAAHEGERASVAAAQDQAASAEAQQQVSDAHQQAADANARADAAQQAAASSAADAAAARDAAMAAQSQPTQVQTTVSTQHPAVVHRSTTVVHHTTQVAPAPPTDQVTTTTTVSPH
jgi:hypothetical protein